MALRLPGHRARAASLALITTGATLGWLLPAAASAGSPVTASSAAAPTDDWPQIGYGPGQSSYNDKERAIGPRGAARLRAAWTIADSAAPCVYTCSGSAAAVVHGVVYQSTAFGVFARQAATGHLLWRAPLGTGAVGTWPREFRSFPAVGGGMVFVGTGFQNLLKGPSGIAALNAANGQTLWTLHYPYRQPPGKLILAKGVLYADIGPALDAVDPKTGHVRWSRTGPRFGPLAGRSVAAVAGGRVYAVTFAGVVALSPATGRTLWHFVPRNEARTASFVVAVRHLVYAGFGPDLYQLDQRTGRVLSKVRVCRCVLADAAVANGIVYTTATANATGRSYSLSTWYVKAIGGTSTAALWRLTFRTTGRPGVSVVIMPTPVAANGLIYLEEYDAHSGRTTAEAVRTTTGKVLWHARLPIRTWCYLTVAEGKLFASLTTGMIAFAPR
jgi:outer membrane protein assembly factor BamB